MATIVTEDEEMIHNGEALPVLSASAKKMRIDKLLNAPLPDLYVLRSRLSSLDKNCLLDVPARVQRSISHDQQQHRFPSRP